VRGEIRYRRALSTSSTSPATPKATRAYAWSSPIEGSTKRRFFGGLHTDKIN
jgi:hypothetical protein